MHVAVGVACSLAIVTYPVVPESIRWLACNERGAEAEKILDQVARGNGRTISKKQRSEIRKILKKTAEESRYEICKYFTASVEKNI